MEPSLFDELLNKVKAFIQKQDTYMSDAISAHDRLCVTLRFLAYGASYKDLSYSFRMSTSAISNIVPVVLQGNL